MTISFSIQLNSNRPAQIKRFLEAVETTADKPENIEVLVHIDRGDAQMEQALATQIKERKLRVRVHQTALVQSGFADLWKPLNELLAMTDPDAYFIMNASDEFIFETKGWDTILRSYQHYYPDDIFRLRCSKFRFRNYQDLWECGFAPDSLAFYTKRWMEVVGQWAPCIGPDSFQQCIAFHLSSEDPFGRQCFRDIAEPFLKFSGEGTSTGEAGEAYMQTMRMHYREWFRLMSPNVQLQAKRAAMLLAAHVFVAEKDTPEPQIVDEQQEHKVYVYSAQECLRIFDYNIKAWRMQLSNAYRALFFHYYGGGGAKCLLRWNPIVELVYAAWCRSEWVYRFVNHGLKWWVKCRLPLASRFRKHVST